MGAARKCEETRGGAEPSQSVRSTKPGGCIPGARTEARRQITKAIFRSAEANEAPRGRDETRG